MIDLADVWDFHTDLRLLVLPESRDEAFRHDQLDLATARRLGGVFSATGRRYDRPREEQWRELEMQVAAIRGIEGLRVVESAADLIGAGLQVLHAEGVYFIQEEAHLDDLDRLWAIGFRSLAPMYNTDSALGGGARGDAARGLTRLGRAFVRRAWEHGFMLDCAHANHRTHSEMIDLALDAGRPVHYTHGLLDNPVLDLFAQRGLPRPTAERLVATGGLIGLSPHPGFQGDFSRFLDEVAFLADIAPYQAVLGSDFTGIGTPPRTFPQFPSAEHTPAFAEMLAERHGSAFARDFCGGNLLRMLRTALP